MTEGFRLIPRLVNVLLVLAATSAHPGAALSAEPTERAQAGQGQKDKSWQAAPTTANMEAHANPDDGDGAAKSSAPHTPKAAADSSDESLAKYRTPFDALTERMLGSTSHAVR